MRATTLFAALLAALVAVFAAGRPPDDPDLFWHLASGEWMLERGALLERDVWSHTREGVPYSTGQWLGQVLMALVYRAGGWLGIDLLRSSLVAVSAFFLARATLRVRPEPVWATLPILGALLVGSTIWGDRPQLFSVALFPVFLDLLLAARLEDRVRRLAALPVLTLLWANLHGAFVAGIALMAIFLIEALLTRGALRRPLALALGASAVMALANPAGPGALTWAAEYASGPGRFIVEERPPDVFTGSGLVFAGLLLAAIFIVMRSEPETLAARLGSPVLLVGLVAAFAYLGLSIQRQLFFACCILAPVVAGGLPAVVRGRVVAPAPLVSRGPAAALLALALTVGLAGAAFAAARAPDLSDYPEDALDALAGRPGPLLNEYDWGGFLIRYAPGHPVFIDGRGAALYVPEVLSDYLEALGVGPRYEEVLDRHDIRLVLLRPERPLAVALREKGWNEVARKDDWILLERP